METVKTCPRCGGDGPHGLMMRECDYCVNEICKTNAEKTAFISENGLWKQILEYRE